MAGVLALAIGFAAAGQAAAANSKAAAIVVDANTGKTLYSSSADSRRYPASLTKMMTLYMVFEALSQGKITKSTAVPFSAQASAEPPTKLGVKAGRSITVETAILSLVTKSANDSATALGELVGGSREQFARMMTAKARSLGMSGTVFRNANGLPNTAQFTTARDMATLGMALRQHYPQYYPYFSTRSFAYGRQRIPNHNRLLGRVKGVDGIKTGYTRASGFNLVSSVSVGNRRIVAVVMGGTSGASRDRQMAELIAKYLPAASPKGKGGALIAKSDSPVTTVAKLLLPKNEAPTPSVRIEDNGEETFVTESEQPQQPKTTRKEQRIAKAKPLPAQPEPVVVEQAYAEPEAPAKVDPVQTASVAPSGWAIQVASSPSKSEATEFLAKASKKAPSVLAKASGFTVTFDKGGVTYHRARFGGFGSQTAAAKACTALKKKSIPCYAVEN